MKHVLNFKLFESLDEGFVQICDRLLSGIEIWERNKRKIERNPPVLTIKRENLDVIAQFDFYESTSSNIILLLDEKNGTGFELDGTLAHELTHALQFLEKGDLDLFTTDITRELGAVSQEEIWEDLMLGIYLIDPIEEEAWKSECRIYVPETINYMVGWMKKFDPVVYASQLREIKPDENEWGLESFDDLPQLWSEIYNNYKEGVDLDPKIVGLGELTLEEFLGYFDSRFKGFEYKVFKK